MPYECTSWKWFGMDLAGSDKTGSNDWNPSMRHQCCLWTRGWTLGLFFPGHFIRKPRWPSKKKAAIYAAAKMGHWKRVREKKKQSLKKESTMLHVILIVSILWLWKFFILVPQCQTCIGKCIGLLYWLLWSITLGCACANAMVEACQFDFFIQIIYL